MTKEERRLRRVLNKLLAVKAPKHVPQDRRYYHELCMVREIAMAGLVSKNYCNEVDLDLDARDSELRASLPKKIRDSLPRTSIVE